MHHRLGSSFLIVLFLTCSGCQTLGGESELLKNSALPTIKTDFPGNPYKHGKFVGPYRSIQHGGRSLWDYMIWKFDPDRPRDLRETESSTPVVAYSQAEHGARPHLAWLGHATVLLNLQGKTILIDPILKSPRLFHGKRLGDLPVEANQLSVDILLATHAHRDHLDRATVVELQGESMRAFTPLKMGGILRDWRPDLEIQEAGWFQSYRTGLDLEITLLPAYHWSRRSIFDTNAVLWGSYLVTYGDVSIFIAGDSGYGQHFKEIGELFDDIDFAILPIGSYDPAHVHQNSHMTPEEALQAFQDLAADRMIPVHYGTYDLSAEPIAEPLQRLEKEVEERGISANSIDILDIGEVLYLE